MILDMERFSRSSSAFLNGGGRFLSHDPQLVQLLIQSHELPRRGGECGLRPVDGGQLDLDFIRFRHYRVLMMKRFLIFITAVPLAVFLVMWNFMNGSVWAGIIVICFCLFFLAAPAFQILADLTGTKR
jgi:hypothetical protein